jgi:predicted double-glycine peptidase
LRDAAVQSAQACGATTLATVLTNAKTELDAKLVVIEAKLNALIAALS